jgi:hypothetical protein
MRKPPNHGGRWQGRGPRDAFIAAAERRGRSQTTEAQRDEIRAWFIGNLVDGWFTGSPEIDVDDHEIVVVGELEAVRVDDEALRPGAESARVERFREDTRDRRIEIAEQAEQQFARHVSWGARVGNTTRLFTTASVPVMTRLNMRQRHVLDTLVDAGVARSRSEALAWCVELVGRNEQQWIENLRSALEAVEQARSQGPSSTTE